MYKIPYFRYFRSIPMGFKEHKQLNLAAVAQDILSFWEEESIFYLSVYLLTKVSSGKLMS